MKEIQVLDEKSLQLQVKQEQLGRLQTNAEQIRDLVKARISDYSLDNYNESNIDKAKADKALLNKAKKALNDERIKLEKSFMQPFMAFKDVVNETVKLIDKAVKDIDTVVKASDEKAKTAKRDQIAKIAEEAGLEELGVKLDLIFNDKWLNKSTSLKKVREEIDARINGINSDLETLKTFAEDYDVLVVRYKEHLDLNETVAYANQLKAQREASKAAEDANATPASIETEQPKVEAPAPTEQPKEQPQQPTHHVIDDADDAFAAALGQGVDEPATHTTTFEITATEDDMTKVVDFLEANNITFNIK